jgi:Short C-terminal domain
MLIRPPVVREMRQNLWVKMTAKPDHRRPQTEVASPEESETDVRLERLKALGELRSSGVLTDDEFELEKARILA